MEKPDTKVCSKCKRVLPLTTFHRNRAKNDGLGDWCKGCAKEYKRENKEYYQEYNRNYARAYSRTYRAKHKEETLEYGRTWRQTNPIRCRANNARRRAVKLNAPGYAYTKARHIQARWEVYDGLCWICGAKATATDHVIPLQPNYREKPGSHWPSNLRPICGSCNSSKSNSKPVLTGRGDK